VRRLIIALIAITLALAGYAYGAIQGATVTEGGTNQTTETTAGSDGAYGGNVTLINLTATVSTDRWQGYFGNVTGTLALGYGADLFYDFSAATALNVYASQNQSFAFGSLEAAAAADVDTQWGYGTGNDQAVDVFTGSSNISGVVVPSAELEPDAANLWYTGIFDDSGTTDKSYFAFGCNVTDGSTAGFDGTGWHYQLMVPADGLETYYFFVQI